ncbi:transglutaminase family protein, partial [Cryobacterium sp. MLB-32]|uniref:transglutaminase-like domain-containing protein n=1 Tax=Cryobacterium sp. MLB-32 TaxID=1529318 RepID=UPI0012E08A4C
RRRATRVASPRAVAAAGARRLLWGAAVLAVALVVGVGVGHVGQPAAARQVLRDTIVPPLDLRQYPSPLVSFRKYVRDFTEKPLLTVTGLPDGARVRLATLDQYDGVVYNVSGDGSAGSGTFARVGTEIADAHEGRQATLDVTIGGLSGAWVPTLGYVTSFAFHGDRRAPLTESLHYNDATGSALSTTALQEGDSYTVTAVVPLIPTDAQLADRQGASLSMPASAGVPNAVASAAAAAVGDAETPIAEVRAIESTLQNDGFLSHGLEGETSSRSGHGADRIGALLGAKQMVGDDEQYAVAMALEVAQLGLPARVVMGWYPPAVDGAVAAGSVPSGAVQLRSADLHAWVEVAFDGYGWVSFDPTPPEDRIPQTEQPQPKSEPQAQVLQPPLPVQAPVELPPAVLPQEALDESPVNIWATVLAVAGAAAGVLSLLLVLFGPVLLVGLLKARRRRRRRGAEQPSERLSGGWSEVTDTATDLGVRLTPGATRAEGSSMLAAHYPDAGITVLAARVDAGVFGPGEATDAELLAFWVDVDRLTSAMTHSVGPWARLRARLSLRSLTQWTRPPHWPRRPRLIFGRFSRTNPTALTATWRRTP